VVNSLLLFIERIQPKGFLIAATNLERTLDPAVWRRFNEVIWFEKPNHRMIERFMRLKFKNIAASFDPASRSADLEGYSYAEIERICVQAIKSMIIERRKQVDERDFNRAVEDETRRRARSARFKPIV
jgi:AAA+ superfamily predicted ATPase